MDLLGWIAIAILFIWVWQLAGRIRSLESPERRPYVPPQTSPQPESVNTGQTPVAYAQYQKSENTVFDNFVAWVKEDWLLKLGALLVLIGFGWFVSYAFLKGWIGPMGRIAFGIISGVLILLIGEWRIRKYNHQGGIFLVLGSTIILLTLFAAREIYDFFTPLTALAVMFLSTAFVALDSVRYKTQALALASLVLAGIAPLLTNASPDYIGLFAYLFVIVLGAIWIVVITGWRNLTPAALILVGAYSVPHIVDFVNEDTVGLLLFSFAFTTVFFITHTVGVLKLKDKEAIPDLVTAAGTGLFLLAWVLAVAPEVWQSLIISAWTVAFLVGAFMIFRATGRKEPFYVYSGVGIAMLAAATAVELSGPALTIAYTIETVIVIYIASLVLKNFAIIEKLCFLFVGPIALSLQSFTSINWKYPGYPLHDDFVVIAVVSIALLSVGLSFLREKLSGKLQGGEKIITILLSVGSIYAYALLWLSLHQVIINNDKATIIALVIYTIIGLASYIYGKLHGLSAARAYGAILLAVVVGRLLLVEVWRMQLTWRIITFFLIGILLMSTAFIGRKKKHEISGQ